MHLSCGNEMRRGKHQNRRSTSLNLHVLLCFLESLAYVLSLFHVFTSCSIRISEFLRLREDTIIFYEDFAADGEAVPAAVCERDVV